MKTLESGKDKIQKICETLKNETLAPARQEAGEIVENARLQHDAIIKKAHEEADQIIENAKAAIEQKKKAFLTSLQLSARQGLELLRQQIENQFFRQDLAELAKDTLSRPDVIAKLVNAIITAIDKEGVDADLSVYIAAQVKPEEVSRHLLATVLARLQEQKVFSGDFSGGAKIRMHGDKMTLDISDQALRDLLADFIRLEFRSQLFA